MNENSTLIALGTILSILDGDKGYIDFNGSIKEYTLPQVELWDIIRTSDDNRVSSINAKMEKGGISQKVLTDLLAQGLIIVIDTKDTKALLSYADQLVPSRQGQGSMDTDPILPQGKYTTIEVGWWQFFIDISAGLLWLHSRGDKTIKQIVDTQSDKDNPLDEEVSAFLRMYTMHLINFDLIG